MLQRILALVAVLFLALASAACGNNEGSAKEFCALEDKFESESEPDAEEDPEKALERVAEQLDEAEAKAPDEIKDDVKIVAEAYKDFAEKSKDLDAANPDDAEAMEKAGEDLQSEEVEKASENLTKWTEENCKDGKVKE